MIFQEEMRFFFKIPRIYLEFRISEFSWIQELTEELFNVTSTQITHTQRKWLSAMET